MTHRDDVAALAAWADGNPEAWAQLRDGTATVVPTAPSIAMIGAANGEARRRYGIDPSIAEARDIVAAVVAAGRMNWGSAPWPPTPRGQPATARPLYEGA